MVIVSVRDNGVGIDPEILPRLFTKFASKSFTGTGLRLYISKSIVEAHGGRIWAENNPARRGATFSFSLPLRNENNIIHISSGGSMSTLLAAGKSWTQIPE
jgi:two-component system, OmpR family, sensor histidine kinase VicK